MIYVFKPYSKYVIHIETSQWTTNGYKILITLLNDDRLSRTESLSCHTCTADYLVVFFRNSLKYLTAFDFFSLHSLYIILCYISVNEKAVGFTVGLQQFGNNFSLGIVMYPYVITNTGNGYDTKTGKFTSPRKGTYVFFVTTVSHERFSVYLDIVYNGVPEVRTTSTSGSYQRLGQIWWFSSYTKETLFGCE